MGSKRTREASTSGPRPSSQLMLPSYWWRFSGLHSLVPRTETSKEKSS
uniref:Uncharacterized protein n=1 Tax=Nelumbo nucifera TaxID=4432 RepID=A0A822Y4K2_NELNU|nr:TPA_asm: hypothetical protein HUJ06_030322 [Nelumbo nucifera]